MNPAIGMINTSHSVPVPSAAAELQHRRLTDAAQQFEGMLLQELLKPMKEKGFDSSGDSDGGSDASGPGDTMSSYGAEALATAIARSGGLGIAARVTQQVEGERAAHAGPGGKEARQKNSSPGAKV